MSHSIFSRLALEVKLLNRENSICDVIQVDITMVITLSVCPFLLIPNLSFLSKCLLYSLMQSLKNIPDRDTLN
jgi:hypothetical protein